MKTLLFAFLATLWVYICLSVVALVGTYCDELLGLMAGLFMFFLTMFTIINFNNERLP